MVQYKRRVLIVKEYERDMAEYLSKHKKVIDFELDNTDECYDMDWFVLFENIEDMRIFYSDIRKKYENYHIHMLFDQAEDLVADGEDLWVDLYIDI